MAFTSPITIEIAGTQSGKRDDANNNYTVSSTSFEEGLKVGVFCKLDAGSFDNIDASSTPVIAGVVVRNDANAIEAGDTYRHEEFTQIEVCRAGGISVAVKDGETPVMFGDVFVHNLADADAGKAVTSATDAVAANAEFIREVATNVWIVRLK